jgi:hypothetical protein
MSNDHFLEESQKKWEEKVRQYEKDERYNESARRKNELEIDPYNEYVERNPELGLKKRDRLEEKVVDWKKREVAKYTASLERSTRFDEKEAREWMRIEKIGRELTEQKEKRKRDAEREQQEEWDRSHPKEVAKRKREDEKWEKEFQKKLERQHPEIRVERERKEKEKKERMKKVRQEKWEREHPEEIEKRKREQKEREEKAREEREKLEKWKLEHPEEWKWQINFWAIFSILLGIICGGLWFVSLDIAVAYKGDLGGYWSACGIQSLLTGVLFLIYALISGNWRSCGEAGILGIVVGAVVAVPMGLLVGVIPATTSATIGVWLGACIGAWVRFYKLDELGCEVYAEKKCKKPKHLVLFCTLFGMISGGAWFATLDIAIASQSTYGGYWCIWGIHGLVLVVLFSLCEGLNTGLVKGSRLSSILLIIGPIVIGVVALLGLLVEAISIKASVIVGALVGAFWGAVIASPRESENIEQ